MSGQDRKVLIADDEPEILELLSLTLEDDELYSVLTARDGEEALRICKKEQPEIVFLDVQMPKMDGITVCENVRRDPALASMKVVMLTALAQESELDRALIAGADDYMTKSFKPSALRQKLLQAMGFEEAAA